MKYKSFIITIISVLVIILLLTACDVNKAARTIDTIENSFDNSADSIEKAVEDVVKDAVSADTQVSASADTTPTGEITRTDAESIALSHAGFASDQVKYLRTEYEIDDGVPQYEIEFRQDVWEYDYTIHAESGAIISFEKDN